MKVLAIIPARGNSKRVPGKALRSFADKPLIAWTIEAAEKSERIDRVLVTTDSPTIRQTALRYGAEVPFLRPASLSTHTRGIEPVMLHALDWLAEHEQYEPDAIALLMPTNPLKRPGDIDAAISLFEKRKADSVVSVSAVLGNNNPYWMLKKENGKVTLFDGSGLKKIATRSQDLPTYYSRNDILYILKPKNLRERVSNLYGAHVELFVMDEFFHGDINTEEDWRMALDKFRRLKRGVNLPFALHMPVRK